MTPQDQTWLAEAAISAGGLAPERALSLSLRSATVAEAWDAVAAACGVDAGQIARWLCERFQIPRADMARADPAFRDRLPAALRARRLICAIGGDARSIQVATANPHDTETEHLLQFSLGMPVQLVLATPAEILALNRRPEITTEEQAVLRSSPAEAGVGNAESIAAIVRLGNKMLGQAMDAGVSDIHIQPRGKGGVVRMRIDGVLQDRAELSKAVMERLQARIKVVAAMDPTDSTRAQDGHHHLVYRGRQRDIRVSSVPARGGEKLVMRLLGGTRCDSLAMAGIRGVELRQMQALLARPQGLFIVTGPTGSGKTTTLYSALAEIHQPGLNITTVEDPVEIEMEGLTQIEVNPKADMTFANALRSVLRQDPDIVLIGEIRDAETAAIALQASITGHLVLASLHTPDAVGAVARLTDLGVPRQLLVEALVGVQAQRLVRRLCKACRQQVPTPAALASNPLLAGHPHVHEAGSGCAACAHTGYSGRLPVCQVFTLTPDVAAELEVGAPLSQVRALAMASGMRRLFDSALERVADGETSLSEIERVLGAPVAAASPLSGPG